MNAVLLTCYFMNNGAHFEIMQIRTPYLILCFKALRMQFGAFNQSATISTLLG